MGGVAAIVAGDLLFNKGGLTKSVTGALGLGGTQPAAQPHAESSGLSDQAQREQEANRAAERRRRMYAGVGRSSTILTTPSGLGTLGDTSGAPKVLLGV